MRELFVGAARSASQGTAVPTDPPPKARRASAQSADYRERPYPGLNTPVRRGLRWRPACTRFVVHRRKAKTEMTTLDQVLREAVTTPPGVFTAP
jgi:hypothetical protein